MSNLVYYADFLIIDNLKVFLDKIVNTWFDSASNPIGLIRFFNRLVFYILYTPFHSQVIYSYVYIIVNLIFVYFAHYLFFRQTLNLNQKTSFVGSFIALINPLFLDSFAKIGLLVSASSILLMITFLKKFLETSKIKYYIYFLFTYQFSLIHPFYITINSFIIGLYLMYKYKKTRKILPSKVLLLSILLTVLLNAYLLTFVFLHAFQKSSFTNETISSISIIHLGYKNFATYLMGFKNYLMDFQIGSYSLFIFTSAGVFLFMFFPLMYKKLNNQQYAIYRIFFFLFLLTFLFSTGTFFHIDKVLDYLYQLPNFGWVFRSHYKWLLYVALTQNILITLALSIFIFNEHKRFHTISLILFLTIFIARSQGMIFNIYRKLLVPKHKPYFLVRVLSVTSCPSTLGIDLATPSNVWKPIYIYRKYECSYIFQLFTNPNKLKLNNYTYLITNCSHNQNDYLDSFFQLLYLQDNICFFKNKNLRPHIYTTLKQETIYKNTPYQQVDFQYIDPTQYKVHLKNISQPLYLNFSESFHPEWKIRVGEFKWYKAFEQNYFIDDKHHLKNDAGLSSFYIDPQGLCQKFACTKNKDGSYNLNLTLYFKPQSYMNFGLIVSGTTFVLVIGYLGYAFISERRNKVKRTV